MEESSNTQDSEFCRTIACSTSEAGQLQSFCWQPPTSPGILQAERLAPLFLGERTEETMSVKNNRGIWMVIGVLAGLFLGNLAPNTPLHASATHGSEGFAIATGEVEPGLEAIYFLDNLTGELTGYVINRQTGTLTTAYKHNVLADLAADTKNPKFLIVTGTIDLRMTTNRIAAGRSVVYVAESTSGKFAAYAVPWQSGRMLTPQPQILPFKLLAVENVRAVAVRDTTTK
jgi:hypothetical protein